MPYTSRMANTNTFLILSPLPVEKRTSCLIAKKGGLTLPWCWASLRLMLWSKIHTHTQKKKRLNNYGNPCHPREPLSRWGGRWDALASVPVSCEVGFCDAEHHGFLALAFWWFWSCKQNVKCASFLWLFSAQTPFQPNKSLLAVSFTKIPA